MHSELLRRGPDIKEFKNHQGEGRGKRSMGEIMDGGRKY